MAGIIIISLYGRACSCLVPVWHTIICFLTIILTILQIASGLFLLVNVSMTVRSYGRSIWFDPNYLLAAGSLQWRRFYRTYPLFCTAIWDYGTFSARKRIFTVYPSKPALTDNLLFFLIFLSKKVEIVDQSSIIKKYISLIILRFINT